MNERNARFALHVFIGVELMLFAALASAFLLYQGERGGMSGRPPFLPLGLTLANTAVLLASGAAAFRRRLGAALLLGAVFLSVQGAEWTRLVHHGLTLRTGAFGGLFYLTVGLHALHALGGVAWLGWAFRRAGPLGTALAVRYWLFVVLLWPLLFGLLYLPRIG